MDFNQVSNETLNGLISEWQSNHKALYSNFFGLQKENLYEYCMSENTIMIRLKEFDFFRIYLMSDDKKDLLVMLGKLNDDVYVFNVPTKDSIDDWEEILVAGGFKFLETFSKMSNTKFANLKITQTEGTCLATIDELEQIQQMLEGTFSVYTAHIPSREELIKSIENGTVRVEHAKDGKICSLVIYSVTGTTATASAWISNGEHGMDLYLDMFNYFIEKGAKRYVFWVRDSNVKVKKLYEKLGAVSLGVKDYTYIKN